MTVLVCLLASWSTSLGQAEILQQLLDWTAMKFGTDIHVHFRMNCKKRPAAEHIHYNQLKLLHRPWNPCTPLQALKGSSIFLFGWYIYFCFTYSYASVQQVTTTWNCVK